MQHPTRRQVLQRAAGGFAGLALHAMLSDEHRALAAPTNDPLAARQPHFAPRAKRVIFLYMTGGVSHVDSFDHKPTLFRDHGKQITVDNWQGKLGEFPRYLKRPD
mgnify:FL=1